MNLTEEQLVIINCNEPMIAINAFAGTGKTSTLVEYAKKRPDWTFLYIAYNKAMQEEALTKFPRNVECRTLHSLAYGKIGKTYPKGKIGNNRIWDLGKALNLSESEQLQVKMANDLLTIWLNSSEPHLDENTLNSYLLTVTKIERERLSSAAVADHRLALARKLWDLMLDKTRLDVKMPHDGYLKLFHLSNPIFNFDCVMLDEAQDSNDVTLAIMNIAQCSHKVIVGDVHQAIYQFRGSKNALADFQKIANKTFYLTNSFRFNTVIADYATNVLNYFKAETHAVIGVGLNGSIKLIQKLGKNINKGSTVLARRNSTLFRLAIDALSNGKKVYFAGGIDKYDLGLLTSIANLDIGGTITHPLVRKFKRVNLLMAYAEDVGERDIVMFSKLVQEHGGSGIQDMLQKLLVIDDFVLRDPIKNMKTCDYYLTTAHRSKGLEFEDVIIADDFTSLYQLIKDDTRKDYQAGELSPQSISDYEQEINLYYVAITRAKKQLTLVNCQCYDHIETLIDYK